MRVNPFDRDVILGYDLFNRAVCNFTVPDSEGRRRASDIGLGEGGRIGGEATATHTRVDPNAARDAGTLELLTKLGQLADGAAVQLDALLDHFFPSIPELLCRQANVAGSKTGVHSPVNLVDGRSIYFYALRAERLQNAQRRSRLHCVPVPIRLIELRLDDAGSDRMR